MTKLEICLYYFSFYHMNTSLDEVPLFLRKARDIIRADEVH